MLLSQVASIAGSMNRFRNLIRVLPSRMSHVRMYTVVARKKTYSIYSWLVLTVRESMATGSKKAEFEMSADACIGVL